MLAIAVSALLVGTHGTFFQKQSAGGATFQVFVDESTTTVSATIPTTSWAGIGFGALGMTDTVAVIFDGSSSDMSQWQLGAGNAGTQLDSTYWTISESTTSNGETSFVMSRDNDISEQCESCYVFDPSSTTLSAIMAVGSTDTFPSSHGANYATSTLSSVTADSLDYEECVSGAQADVQAGSISVSMSRNSAFDYMKIVLQASDTSYWFAVGFGNTIMSGTYALISQTQELSGQYERQLGGASNRPGTPIADGSNSWDYGNGEGEITVADGQRTVTIYRSYATDDDKLYDFTEFMEASVNYLEIISALGRSDEITEGHGGDPNDDNVVDTNYRGSTTIYTTCSEIGGGGSTPSPVTPGDDDDSAGALSYVVAVVAGVLACIAA